MLSSNSTCLRGVISGREILEEAVCVLVYVAEPFLPDCGCHFLVSTSVAVPEASQKMGTARRILGSKKSCEMLGFSGHGKVCRIRWQSKHVEALGCS